MSVTARNNVHVLGRSGPLLIVAHGFGCDQNMWRLMTLGFTDNFRVVLFDHVGAGKSDLTAWSPERYQSLKGYAEDVVEILRELDLAKAIFVGHSVSAMIGVLAARMAPDLFSRLILVSPSPRYINDGDYVGGFSALQIEELLDFLNSNHMGWSATMAPTIMGNPDRPELGDELTNSFCRTDPEIARHFARTTFTSDNRADLPYVQIPTLILQCREDLIALQAVGQYVHEMVPASELVLLDATGHCPNLSAPGETSAAIRNFLSA
jgi:sigma-B regulation protein RsbQ